MKYIHHLKIPTNTSNYTYSAIKPNAQQPIKPIKQQSTNPENELVDLLSNLSMDRVKIREDKTLNNSNKNDYEANEHKKIITEHTSQNLNPVDGVKNIKSNYGLGKLGEDENQAWSKYRS